MSLTVRFEEHQEFHRAATHMAVAGLFAGLGAHVARLLAPALGSATGPFALACLVGGIAWGATPERERARVARLVVLVAGSLLAAAALSLLGGVGPAPTVGALIFSFVGGALVVRRRGLLLVAGAAATLLAHWVLVRLVEAPALAALPAWTVDAAAGAAFGGVALLGLLPRHVVVAQDRVAEAWEQAQGKVDVELRELLARAVDTWQRTGEAFAPGSPERRSLEESVLRLCEVAARWHDTDAERSSRATVALASRLEDLDARLTRTEDAVARGQYEEARAAVAAQLRYVREIAAARERVLARMHHYVAALERLRWAVVHHRSADASRVTAEVQPLLGELEALGRDIDLNAEAISEVERS
jgi:hypothetical protein